MDLGIQDKRNITILRRNNAKTNKILPIILENRKEGQFFYDLFCGGGNVVDKIDGNVLGNDCNEFAVEALKLIRDGLDQLPKTNNDTNEQTYKEMKKSKHRGLKGYYGFSLSYGGKWFGGWRRDKEGKRDYIAEAYRNAVKQSNNIQNVVFTKFSYSNTSSFDYEVFYNWCIEKAREGHEVFISEYYMPENNFKCLWSKEIVSSLTKNTGSKKGVEKLFKVRF